MLYSRENMTWLWLDPLRKLKHHVVKMVYGTPQGVDVVEYETYCKHAVTVDDVNPKTKVVGSPTCLRCIVAVPLDDVIPTEE